MPNNESYLKDIFKISVSSTELNLPNKKQFFNKLMKESETEGRQASNVTGYQSNNLDIKDPIYRDFIHGVESQAKQLARDINIVDNLVVENFWLNINYFKDSNSVHCHPGGVFSGVYYVKVPEHSGDIVFMNPTHDYMDFYWHNFIIKGFNNYNGTEFNVVPYTDQLLIFPSWLKHYVKPNLNHELRLSISFNLGVKDERPL